MTNKKQLAIIGCSHTIGLVDDHNPDHYLNQDSKGWTYDLFLKYKNDYDVDVFSCPGNGILTFNLVYNVLKDKGENLFLSKNIPRKNLCFFKHEYYRDDPAIESFIKSYDKFIINSTNEPRLNFIENFDFYSLTESTPGIENGYKRWRLQGRDIKNWPGKKNEIDSNTQLLQYDYWINILKFTYLNLLNEKNLLVLPWIASGVLPIELNTSPPFISWLIKTYGKKQAAEWSLDVLNPIPHIDLINSDVLLTGHISLEGQSKYLDWAEKKLDKFLYE